MTTRTRDVLWSDIETIYAAILDHPFLTGLSDGSLPREAFGHYIVQDALYLRGYAAALAGCAARAPRPEATVMFAEHAAGAIAAERELHESLLGELGVDPADLGAPSPATQAYVSYLTAIVQTGSYAEAVAAVLPCYWIYARVGEALVAAGSPDPLYQAWIDLYAGEEFRQIVDAVLTETDTVGATASPVELERMRQHFTTTSRYEWMFWDGAYRQETWPV
ncbi:thiaminase II [Enemella evansiae]|uniref:thiaminase II n=1 Tax=Enemella evansiae TaxID=2016499 RepID=UPI0010604132|nr:thiaminase II [Enemella evansiae]TDO89773.1 thiaminase /4-amino-5-aminomethyl-2-methylpyrimidine deaminase [Enemella evansiae]